MHATSLFSQSEFVACEGSETIGLSGEYDFLISRLSPAFDDEREVLIAEMILITALGFSLIAQFLSRT